MWILPLSYVVLLCCMLSRPLDKTLSETYVAGDSWFLCSGDNTENTVRRSGRTGGRRETMDARKYVRCAALLTLGVIAYYSASGMLTAQAVLPPDATSRQIVATLLRPPYQILEPHQDVLGKVVQWVSLLSPVGEVCADYGYCCNATIAQPGCQPGCNNGCYCPDCVTGPCTPYFCQDTQGLNHYCLYQVYGSGPCQGCENDTNVNCNP